MLFLVKFEDGEVSRRNLQNRRTINSYIMQDYYTKAQHDMDDVVAISVPDGIRNIGEFTFADMKSLLGVRLPETLENIGTAAFQGCEYIRKITIPPYVRSIDRDAFFGTHAIIDCSQNPWAEQWAEFNGFTKVGNHQYRA